MKAHKAKYNTKVTVTDDDITIPPCAPTVKKGDVLTILHLDGMYVNAIDDNENRVYIANWTEVKPITEES